MRRLLFSVLSCLAVVATPRWSAAQDIPGYPSVDAFDPREVALLPEFCKYTTYFRDKVPGGNNKSAIEGWRGVLGPTFLHVHHYCFGLMKTHRGVLLARGEQVRKGYLSDSLREFDYVLERATPDFVLLPEILTKKAENQIRLGLGPMAVLQLEQAAEIKPDYWPAYAQLGDYYKGIGEMQKARDVLEKGLAASPGTPALTRRLAELTSATRPPGAVAKSKPSR